MVAARPSLAFRSQFLPSMRTFCTVALALSVISTSCTQAAELNEAEISVDTVSKMTIEPTEEAQEPWTRADCIRAWRHNLEQCEGSPPNLRPACWAAAHALLAACLAAAQG